MSTKMLGRWAGVLVLIQLVLGVSVNLILTAPLYEAPGYLVRAAPIATQVAASVVLGLIVGVLGLLQAILIWSVVRKRAPVHGLFLVALSAGAFALGAVEQTTVMGMLSLSQAFAASGAADPEAYAGLRGVVAESRNWAHVVALLSAGVTLFSGYSLMFHHALISRWLAGFGMAASALQLITVASLLFGGEVDLLFLAPLALAQLVQAAWLLARGFPESAAEGRMPDLHVAAA
jgi:hypothetical protein